MFFKKLKQSLVSSHNGVQSVAIFQCCSSRLQNDVIVPVIEKVLLVLGDRT